VGDANAMSFVERVQAAKDRLAAHDADPWRLPLERVRGKVFDDGVERLATQAAFDFLNVPQRSRSASACRRLAALMRDLGWTPIKARGLNQAGFREQIRGYAREQRRSPLS